MAHPSISAFQRSSLSALLAVVLLACCTAAFADGFKVEDGNEKYYTKIIRAENVRGLKVTLSKDMVQDRCNEFGMTVNVSLVGGTGDGLNDTYFFDARVRGTDKPCSDKEVRKGFSDDIPVGMITNQDVKKRVGITIIVPEGFYVEVKPIR